jgi:hypothetical protein
MIRKITTIWNNYRIGKKRTHYLQKTTVHEIIAFLFEKLSLEPEFLFISEKIPYFFHSYNNLGYTERAIEIPIVKYLIQQYDRADALEIGNVSSHYYGEFQTLFKSKTVVDLYEIGYDVINLDISKYFPKKKFDLVFSISTFEHMDSDRGMSLNYKKGTSKLTSVASDNIQHVADNVLSDKGVFILSAPLGYSKEWDNTFYSTDYDQYHFSKITKYIFKRKGETTWIQTDELDGKKAEYNFPFLGVNFVTFLVLEK